jgi:Mg-chelatase subunit ChlI
MEVNVTRRPAPPDLDVSFSRTVDYSAKLAAALADLRAAGGLRRVASHARESTLRRVAETLASVRGQIDLELADLERPAPCVAPRPLLRRQANRPTPIPTVR